MTFFAKILVEKILTNLTSQEKNGKENLLQVIAFEFKISRKITCKI